MTRQQKFLVIRLFAAVVTAFVASMALNWIIHGHVANRERRRLFEKVFYDVGSDIRWRVDVRMIRQAMLARDHYYEMREEPWWNDPDESSRRLRALAGELGVDEICIADAEGNLTHSARREEVGALNFRTDKGQAHEFVVLLDSETEFAQSLMPNSLRGEMIKYVGVWLPDGGFIQVGASEKSVRNLARTSVTGITNDWHVSGEDGGIYITTGSGTIISHPNEGGEGGVWTEPSDDFYWEKRMIEGFPVYIVFPRHTSVVERRLLVTTSAIINCIALVFASVLAGIVFAGFAKERMRERVAKDMAMAASIQENAIPQVFPPFADERRMDIFATMHTARDVGGDFYDFFFTSPSKVAFLVADVSGKGVPAALFMMRAKATIKGETRSGLPLNEVMAHVNDALSRDNDANMFVTAWMGVIDLETGEVTFVNAGHNPPILIEGAGDDERKFLRERSGMVLGAMPGLKYRMHTVHLSPGAMIYLYTDGITEQPDGKGELFGEDRLLFSLGTMLSAGVNAIDGSKSPLLAAIFDAVISHGADVEQADDCTQLVIRYNGAGEKRRFTVAQSGIAEASTWLDEWLDKAGVVSLSATLHVILDEICSNIVKHSNASFFELGLSRLVGSSGVRMEFVDDGVPYDPLTHVDPDTTAPVEGRPIGGLGILMVKRMASSVTYQRVADRNCLVIERTCKTQGDCSGSKG
ncbi:MAG: SpoIIE family protein phosphatase [Kiritimatiellae bacterium]|nr:SpoIIE family protein phosphatase [Kiritimatiellia bacterium]